MKELRVFGYRYSVYTRIVRWTLAEKGFDYTYIETNPFDQKPDDSTEARHPYGQVPILEHDRYRLFETAAIIRYLDEYATGRRLLQPVKPQTVGRMVQIQSMIDQQGYLPMVRQLFAHRVFRPFENEIPDEQQIIQGIEGTQKFLAALDSLIDTTPYLCSNRISLADLHLAPMIDYMQLAPEGQSLLANCPKVQTWWRMIEQRPLFVESRMFP